MPKHSADKVEMQAVLKIYSDANDWLENSEFIELMKKELGTNNEPQSYTKKTQIPSYFGFTEWEGTSSQSRRRITESGKRFYKGLVNNDEKTIFDEIIKALEERTFGRDVVGVENSDSDIEPPQLFIKVVLTLQYLKRQEYGYILWKLDLENQPLFELISLVNFNRMKNKDSYTDIPPKYGDAKPITALINWNFLQDEKGQIKINPDVISVYLDRLQKLKVFNVIDPQRNQKIDSAQDSFPSSFKGINVIYYGAPGTGKSYQVNSILKGKEQRTETVTFHPDFDYSSFVGSYKPMMDDTKGNSELRYEFVPQIFTNIYVKAWNDLEKDYFLVIEEINRGNCSEIFGDIFQLLDRNSYYTVTASKELGDFLAKSITNTLRDDPRKLLLPPNLSIIATMNTSDQSLFPMDSAFKRRWDWEYVPINYEKSDNNLSSKFIVFLNENEYFSWLDFIESVNQEIKTNPNLGMDKCIGNFFIKTDTNEISLKAFINKAIFYLWNDVFKDELEDESIFKGMISYEDFFPLETEGQNQVKKILLNMNIQINNIVN